MNRLHKSGEGSGVRVGKESLVKALHHGRYLVFDSDGKRVLGGTADATAKREVYLYDRVTAILP